MDARNNLESGDVEWLDVGPPERPDAANRRGRPGRKWYVLALGVVVAAVLVIALQHDGKHATASPRRSHQLTTTAPAPTPLESSATPPPVPRPVRVTNMGHSVLDVPADWELFGQGTDGIVRVQLARGRITRTTTPPVDTGGGISFVVGRDRAIIRPWDTDLPGYAVQDGRPARQLPSSLGTEGPVLPGPDPDHVWIASTDDKRMNLVGLDGRPAGVSLPAPNGTGSVNPDGAGYFMFYGTGGAYGVRPGRITRITTGEVLAAGPTTWLTRDCDAQYRCVNTVVDRATGSRRTLRAAVNESGVSGTIAPDGSYAAVFTVDGSGQPSLGVLNLTTGHTIALDIPFDPQYSFSSGVCAWSPDSRWLFAAGAEGRLKVFDRHTMRLKDLGISYPVNQVAFRSATH